MHAGDERVSSAPDPQDADLLTASASTPPLDVHEHETNHASGASSACGEKRPPEEKQRMSRDACGASPCHSSETRCVHGNDPRASAFASFLACDGDSRELRIQTVPPSPLGAHQEDARPQWPFPPKYPETSCAAPQRDAAPFRDAHAPASLDATFPAVYVHSRHSPAEGSGACEDHGTRCPDTRGCGGGRGDRIRRESCCDAQRNEAGEGRETGTQRARRKLVMASMVCCVFMFVEIVAGVLANSLALMTDASHLLSDLCAFLISLFALWVSELKGNPSMSFGYHRAEILGALLSVFLIWVLTAVLIYAACFRVFDPPQVDGQLMFWTALLGTLANLFMTHILKVHTHGIGQVHAHESHDAESHGCCENGALRPLRNLERGRCDGHECAESSGRGELDAAAGEKREASSHGCCDRLGLGTAWSRRPSAASGAGSADLSPGVSVEIRGVDRPSREGKRRPVSASSAGSTCASGDIYVRLDEEIDSERNYENMNLRAAYIHALGDLLQNIGVMIASALIWWRPNWAIADPICTFIFSIFVLFTTLSILKEALNVLMEGTPVGIDARALQEDLLLIPGVVEVHDLHVWSLSVGKPSLACHVVVENEDVARSVLRKATVLCQRKYAILHTTIQTDFSSDKKTCETEAHQKCSDPMKVFRG